MTVRAFRHSSLFAALVLFLAGAISPAFARQASSGADQPRGSFRVAGIVVSAATGAPLAQTRVFLSRARNPANRLSVVTQEDGRFSFAGLPAGKYSLQGAHRGYLSAAYEQHEQYSTAIVTGVTDLDTENLTLRLTPMAALSGSVLDENGEPLRNVEVRLYAERHFDGATRVLGTSGTGTDDQGTFEFAPLSPGKYFVSVSATPWYAVHPPSFSEDALPAAVDPSLDVAYPTTFFGGATESDDAEPINLHAGDHAQAEIRFTPVQALRLTVHFQQESARRVYFPVLEQRRFGRMEQVPAIGGISPSSNGVVELVGIPPGHYTYRFRGNGGAATQQEGEIDLRQNGQDLNATSAEPLGNVKLSFQFPKDAPPSGQITVVLRNEKTGSGPVNRSSPDAASTFDELPPGKYTLRVYGESKAYSVAQLSSQDVQILGGQFDLPAGASQDWTVSLVAGNSTLEGVVKRGSKPVSGIMVVLIPKDPDKHTELFRRDQSDLDGSFTLRNIIPGLYTVVAIEDAWGFDWSQPALLARYAQHGQAVTISELIQGAVTLSDPLQVQPR